MLIESIDPLPLSQPAATDRPNRWSRILGTIVTLTVGISLFLLITRPLKPTGSLLSPLPEGEIAETILPSATPSDQPSAIVAAPEEKVATSGSASQIGASSNKTLITLPAGSRELVIRDHTVTANSYIYLTPISAVNDPLFVKLKGEGYFSVATNRAAEADLLFEYYVINDRL